MSSLHWNPEPRHLRQFSAVALVFFGGLAVWFQFQGGSSTLALGLGFLALVIGIPGLARPRSVRMIYVLFSLITLPIGFVLSHFLMLVLYFLVITPIGLTIRLVGRDPLRIRRAGGADSYWVRRQHSLDARSYFRQS